MKLLIPAAIAFCGSLTPALSQQTPTQPPVATPETTAPAPTIIPAPMRTRGGDCGSKGKLLSS